MADTDPLPLVPAMWMNRSSLWGSPSMRHSSVIRSRPGRLPFHSTESI